MKKTIKLSIATTLLLATCSYAQTNDLGTLTVSSATKSTQSIQDVTADLDVITSQELEEKHITTITEALNLVSGISFTSNGGLGKSSSVRVRGFDSNRVLVLVDGVRYNDITSTGGASFENIMIENVQQIEVIKGAQSGIWGADASAGVINIITKTPKEGLNGSIQTEIGSFNTKKLFLNGAYKSDKIYVGVSHSRIETDGFTAYAANGDDIDNYEDDGYENDTSKIKFGYSFDDNNKIDASYQVVDSENEYDSYNSDTDYESTSNTKTASVQYENITNDITTNIHINRSDFLREYPDSSSRYEGMVDEVGIKSNINYLDDSSFVIVGADYKKFDQEDIVNKDYTNKALFITNSNTFNDDTIVTQSLRMDQYSSFDNKLTGKVGVRHNYTQDTYVLANAGTAYNVPTLGQMYGAFGPNPDLNSETTTSYDIGFGYKDLKMTYFYNTIEDMISWSGSGYENIEGKSKINGIELSYKKDITEDILFNVAYTRLLQAEDTDGEDLKRRAEQTVKFGMDYYGIDKLHIGLNGEYVGERFNNTSKTQQTGKYTVINLVTNYDISSSVKIYAKIDNVTDKYYQTVTNYATSPRAYYAGLKYSF